MLNSLDHHAYVVVGSHQSVVDYLLDIFENKFYFQINGNPDFSIYHFDSFGIDESRKIKDMHSSMPVNGDKKIFIISANNITVQAQNSMLKMFEEPLGGTHFFVIVPSTSFFIDTLLSRVVILDSLSETPESSNLNSKKFLKLSYPDRLKVIEKFIKSYKDSKETKESVKVFFAGIESELSKDVKKNREILESVLEIKGYIFDTSASLKMLLETLAFLLPEHK